MTAINEVFHHPDAILDFKKIIRLFDVGMKFTYSITYEKEKTIITITNETGVIIRMQ